MQRPPRSQSIRPRALLLALLALPLVACAPSGTGPRAARETPDPGSDPFPSAEALRDLAQTEATPEPATPVVAVESWSLRGPLGDEIGDVPIPDPNAWETLLLDGVRHKAGLVVASGAMRCAAREFGHFMLERNGFPEPGLRSFIVARCGGTSAGIEIAYHRGRLPPEADEQRVLEAWRESVVEMVRHRVGAGPRAAGIWHGRSGDEGIVVLVSGLRRALIEPISATALGAAGLELRGELLADQHEPFALATAGELGASECEPDPQVRPPRFLIRCPLRREDERAWIDLAARPPNRLLSTIALRLLARPTGDPALTWRRPGASGEAPVSGEQAFRTGLVQRVNGLRSGLGIPPLQEAEEESRVAAQLAPLFFAAALGDEAGIVSDTVVLGLMAGWDVRGPVRGAQFGAVWVADDRSLSRWLGEALAQPSMRRTLLDPAASRIAIGPILAESGDSLAALIATYRLFDAGEDYGAHRNALYRRIEEEFVARQRSAPSPHLELEELATLAATRVQDGSLTRDEAIDWLLEKASARMGASVWAVALEAQEMADLTLPDELFGGDVERIAAAVGHYQPEDAAWARYLVLIVGSQDVSQRRVDLPPAAGASAGRSAL